MGFIATQCHNYCLKTIKHHTMKKIATLLSLIVAIFLLPGTASAGCNINLGVKNANASSIDVHLTILSAVKSKGGVWRRLRDGHWGPSDGWAKTLAPGQSYKDNYAATFGCNKNRRYKIRYECGNDSAITTYYPTATSYTKKTTLIVSLDGC